MLGSFTINPSYVFLCGKEEKNEWKKKEGGKSHDALTTASWLQYRALNWNHLAEPMDNFRHNLCYAENIYCQNRQHILLISLTSFIFVYSVNKNKNFMHISHSKM